MEQLLEFLATHIENLLLCLAVGEGAGWRTKGRDRWLAVTVTTFIVSLVVTYCNHLQAFSLFTCLPPLVLNALVFSFWYAEGPLAARFASHALCITYIFTIDYILCALFGLFFGWDENSFSIIMQPGWPRWIYLVIAKSLDIFMFFGFCRLLRQMVHFRRRSQNALAVFAGLALLLLQLSFSNFLSLDMDSMMISFLFLWLLILLLLFGTMCGAILFFRWTQESQQRQQLQLANQAVLADYHRLQDQHMRQARLRHDIVNHLLVLRSSSAADGRTDAKAYIDRLLQDNYQEVALYNTGCEVVNAILNAKVQIAEKEGIQMTVEAVLNEDTGIAPVDICTVLANQVDNALEACRRMPSGARRWIHVKVFIRDEDLIFRVLNSVAADPFAGNKKLKTTKTDADRPHGLGLQNIRQTARRYGGDMLVDYQDGAFRSTVLLEFPGKKKATAKPRRPKQKDPPAAELRPEELQAMQERIQARQRAAQQQEADGETR